MKNKKIRLNKFIAYSGLCSRRQADKLINLGLISVNNIIIKKMGYKINFNDNVKYNETKIKIIDKYIYILINKPKNCITTVKDNLNRKTILFFIPNKYKKKFRIYPVGRLDKNTTGILLLTNDGYLSNKLLHPKYKINKIYKIILNKNLDLYSIIKIKKGIKLKEGVIKIKKIIINKNKKNIIHLYINLGWNRIIHRIFNKLGYKILYLQRINFGGLKINKYIKKEGKYIILSKKKIYKIIQKNEKNNYY
ncbi:MAG: pseudouridine synthase [Candidatus Shikimatogenerans bostrichidophilus]|nr:MAG: pseudouridine synthase [Candidatus Shikimatogenerans bostrichidophilus]